MGRLAVILLLLAADPTKPSLVVRVSPQIVIANPGVGCAPILLVAEIRGPEVEEWYCPAVEWTWPDSSTSSAESDCPPFDARNSCMESQEGCGKRGWRRAPDGSVVDQTEDCPCTIIGFPRRWVQHVCFPPHPASQAWEIGVRLSRNGRTIARERGWVYVK